VGVNFITGGGELSGINLARCLLARHKVSRSVLPISLQSASDRRIKGDIRDKTVVDAPCKALNCHPHRRRRSHAPEDIYTTDIDGSRSDAAIGFRAQVGAASTSLRRRSGIPDHLCTKPSNAGRWKHGRLKCWSRNLPVLQRQGCASIIRPNRLSAERLGVCALLRLEAQGWQELYVLETRATIAINCWMSKIYAARSI
jgi:hypothetical protein